MRLMFVFVSFFLFFGVFMGGLTWAYDNYLIVDALKLQELEHLEGIVDSEASRIDAFLEERKADAVFLSKIEGIKDVFNQEVLYDVELMKEVVVAGARQTSADVERYLLNNPDKSIVDLQQDPEFKEIAIRRVGETGYTVFYGTETFVNYLHFNPEKDNEGHDHVWNSSVHVQVANLLKTAENSEEDVEGFYHLIESDDEREKYMYISMIPGRHLQEDLKLSIKSVIYIDEFGETIRIASDLDNMLEDFQNNNHYRDIVFIDPEGNIVWSAEQKNDLGTNLEIGPYSDTNLARVYSAVKDDLELKVSELVYYDASGESVVFIASPILIFNSDTRGGELLGVVVLEMSGSEIGRLISSTVGIEEFGEIYVVNRDGEHITSLLHGKDSSRKTFSSQIEKCFTDYDNYFISQHRPVSRIEKSGVYKNYDGIDVLGAHQYILQSGWCVMAEVNEAQFYKDRIGEFGIIGKLTVYVFLILILIVLIFVFIFDYYFKLKERKWR